jgi:hypothetical protein
MFVERSRRELTVLGRCLGIVALILGPGTLTGCATPSATWEREMSSAAVAGVVIENNSWDRVSVFLSNAGRVRLLGVVPAMDRASFPGRRVGYVLEGERSVLIARPLAGNAFESEPFFFRRGDQPVWTIENRHVLSRLSMR